MVPPFYYHKIFKWFLDIILCCAVFSFSLLFRLGPRSFFEIPTHKFLLPLLLIPLALTFACLFFRVYATSWRYFSTYDLRSFGGFFTIFLSSYFLLGLATHSLSAVPRSSLLLFCMLSLLAMLSIRIFHKLKREMYANTVPHGLSNEGYKGGLLYVGDLETLDGWMKGIHLYAGNISYKIVAAISTSDKGDAVGRYIRNIHVIGDISQLDFLTQHIIQQENIRGFLVGNRSTQSEIETLAIVAKTAGVYGLKLFKIPGPEELRVGVGSQNIKPVQIADLLGRQQRVFNSEGIERLLKNKRVLVTGAGGSIGSELVKLISSFDIEKLILIENSEYNLYQIENWLKENKPDLKARLRYCFADIRDKKEIAALFQLHQPHIVYHAAALKHVPLMEDNKFECIKTNILGTKVVVDCCIANSVAHCTMISTDKAVNPENTMGFTKKVAELYCQCHFDSQTHFTIVRFGNVLGSSGSVIPLFKSQIESGGPVTVTDKDATRFFMMISEAVQLILQTGCVRKRNNSDVFILEMGEPIKILHVAEKIIRLSGLRPYIDIPIHIIGLRPGEKLHENLYTQTSSVESTHIPGILVAHSSHNTQNFFAAVLPLVEQLEKDIHVLSRDKAEVVLQRFAAFIPDHKINFSS